MTALALSARPLMGPEFYSIDMLLRGYQVDPEQGSQYLSLLNIIAFDIARETLGDPITPHPLNRSAPQ